ncbi:MAG: TIR domain-containing protein [Cyanobacteria bacterium REEB67]|nr:TIR domain-containing protein [Cyanobacteria bacterium REEB67]
MKVFISWSGDRSKAIAEALRSWLPNVLHFIDPFMSDLDIESGDRWQAEVSGKLETCNTGIICITPENKDKPWVLFESGALSKSVTDGRVIPLLYKMKLGDLGGPLGQFQAKLLSKPDIHTLVVDLNKQVPIDKQIDQVRLELLFNKLYDVLEEGLNKVEAMPGPAATQQAEGEVLEDLVRLVRSHGDRIDQLAKAVLNVGQKYTEDIPQSAGQLFSAQTEAGSREYMMRTAKLFGFPVGEVATRLARLSPDELSVLELRYGIKDGQIKSQALSANRMKIDQARLIDLEGAAVYKVIQPLEELDTWETPLKDPRNPLTKEEHAALTALLRKDVEGSDIEINETAQQLGMDPTHFKKVINQALDKFDTKPNSN